MIEAVESKIEEEIQKYQTIELPEVDITGIEIKSKPDFEASSTQWVIVGFSDYSYIPIAKIWYRKSVKRVKFQPEIKSKD